MNEKQDTETTEDPVTHFWKSGLNTSQNVLKC